MRGMRFGRSAGRERVVGGRPDQVAALAVLVEQHVDAAACRPRGAPGGASAGAELREQEPAVFVGAHAADHGGAVAEARHRVDRVGRLAAAGAHRVDVREGFVHRLAHRGVHQLLGAGRPQLVPQRERAGQPVDQIEVEGAAADQVDRLHMRSSPR